MISYRQALRTIFERTDFERGDRPPYAARVWRLERVEELLAQLGDPHRAYRTIHIAGTKGKGSTTAMIESILRAAGFSTGMYTSPHLHTFRERMRVNGAPISEADVARLIDKMRPLLAARPELTVFEIITALAMCFFAERKVDWGVFEVGLGGRLDATNVIQPVVAVITSISLDHVKVLGDTIEAIAREKAGIIKRETPVVSAPQRPGAAGVLAEIARERAAPLTIVNEDWSWRLRQADLAGQRFDLLRSGASGAPEYRDLFLPLLGGHQLENASVAVAAIRQLADAGIAIPDQAIYDGLAHVQWPGRMEILGTEPLVLADGAHNPYSIRTLLRALPTYLRYERILIVFGASQTHLPRQLLREMRQAGQRLFVTQAHHPKAVPSQELAEVGRDLGYQVTAHDTVSHAMQRALDEAAPRDLVLITGSLFVVAEAREVWAALHDLSPLPSDPPGVY